MESFEDFNRLEDAAYKVFYKHLKSALCVFSKKQSKPVDDAENVQDAKKTKLSPSVSPVVVAAIEAPREEIVEYYRKRFDKFLPASFRRKLVDDFVEEFTKRFDNGQLHPTDLCLFLDCTLDETFTELGLRLPAATCRGPQLDTTKVIETVSKWCPKLERLEAAFSSMPDFFAWRPPPYMPMTVARETAFCSHLSALKNLTYLNICWNSSDDSVPFFSLLGTCCPQMKTLDLAGFPFGDYHLLALVLGFNAKLLPKSAKEKMWGPHYEVSKLPGLDKFLTTIFMELDGISLSKASARFAEIGMGINQMHLFQFNQENVTPICNTIEEIYTGNHDRESCSKKQCTLRHPGTVAFALRHLPRLTKIYQGCDFSRGDEDRELRHPDSPPLSEAIQLLHSQVDPKVGEAATHECHSLHTNAHTTVQWTTYAPFSGRSFGFDSLDDINVCSGKVMVAVVSLCPELKRVTFVGGKQTPESSDEGEPDESSDEGESDESCDDASDTDGDVDAEETGDVDDVEAIQSILRVPDTFKLLKDVTFEGVPPSYVKAVLAAIGPQLLKLRFWSCKDIDAVSLVPCVLLEELFIGRDSSLLKHEDEALESIQTDSFLSNLQQLRTTVCLGNSSRFFEGKSSLTGLNLYCSHVGIPNNDGSVLWDEFPSMWTNLKSLSIDSAVPGLTMSNLCQFLPGLKRLKSVTLPKSVNSTDQDKALADRLKEQLGFRLTFVSPEQPGRSFLFDQQPVVIPKSKCLFS